MKLNSKEKLLPFWESKKKKYKRLHAIAAKYFQIAITEVNVERLFSHVHFILNPLRTSLSSSLLDDIIIIRLNFDIITNSMSSIPLLM